jgi:hypothetical protein
MAFPVSPGEIDALAELAMQSDDHHLPTIFWREADAPGMAHERADAMRLLGFVLGFGDYLPSQTSNQPFGKVGTSNLLKQLTKEQAANLAAIAPDIKNPEIRAIVADAAWLRGRGNPDVARVAAAAYLVSARNLEDPEQWCDGMARAERALRLSRSLGADETSFQSAVQYLLELLNRYRGEDKLFLTGEVIKLLLEFRIGVPADYLEPAQRAAEGALTRNNFHVARFYSDLITNIYRRNQNESGVNSALRAIAQTFEAEAQMRESAGDNLAAAHFYTQAIQAHRRIPASDTYVEAVRPHLQRAERASIAQFKKIAGPSINIAEYARRAREKVTGQELPIALLRLAYISPLAHPTEMREAVAAIAKIGPLYHLVTSTKSDAEGRTVGIAPGASLDPASGDDALFAKIVKYLAVQRNFVTQAYIIPALLQVTLEHAITLSELVGLFTYSPFIPPGHERIFAEGLHAGFQLDFMTAAHLLIPQIENSLRHLMNARGIITTKLDRFGVQRHIDLSELVIDERLTTILSENVLLELRTLLTDNRGPNLRHQLAHGMPDDDAFASAEAVYVWWLVLALCIFGKPVKADDVDIAEPPPSEPPS